MISVAVHAMKSMSAKQFIMKRAKESASFIKDLCSEFGADVVQDDGANGREQKWIRALIVSRMPENVLVR